MRKRFNIVPAPARGRPELAPASGGALRRWCRQFGWLVLIWALSVAALAVCAGLMKLFMRALGMH